MANRGLDDLGEDVTGFGRTELRTIVHTVTRPGALLQAYMTEGPTGGGLYSRPLKLYIALNGVLMVVLFLMGGSDAMLARFLPDELISPLLEQSGKSRDAFLSDMDGWMTLFAIPFGAAAYAVAVAPLIRWWDPEDLGWRNAFRATFVFLNAWTVPLMPVLWLTYMQSFEAYALPVLILASVAAFIRTGRRRWWSSPLSAVGKGLFISLVLQVAIAISSVPLIGLALLGATLGR